MRRGILCAAFAVALLPAQGSAGPSDPLVMTASGGTQEGHVVTSTASQRHGDMCATLHADGVRRRPPAVSHDGSALTWLVPGSRKPSKVRLRMTTYAPFVSVLPVGDRDVPVKVAPVRSRGRVTGWLVTSPETGEGDHDLLLSVAWPGACGEDSVLRQYFVRVLPDPLGG